MNKVVNWDAKGDGIDPITQGKFNYEKAFLLPSFGEKAFLSGSIEIIVNSFENNPFFARVGNTPLKMQEAPLLLKIGIETCPVRIASIECFSFSDDRTEIRFLAQVIFLDNFELIQAIQENKWYWGKD